MGEVERDSDKLYDLVCTEFESELKKLRDTSENMIEMFSIYFTDFCQHRQMSCD